MRVEAIEVPQRPLAHRKTSGVVHEDNGLLRHQGWHIDRQGGHDRLSNAAVEPVQKSRNPVHQYR